jgi:hypothetical protein
MSQQEFSPQPQESAYREARPRQRAAKPRASDMPKSDPLSAYSDAVPQYSYRAQDKATSTKRSEYKETISQQEAQRRQGSSIPGRSYSSYARNGWQQRLSWQWHNKSVIKMVAFATLAIILILALVFIISAIIVFVLFPVFVFLALVISVAVLIALAFLGIVILRFGLRVRRQVRGVWWR